MTNRDDDGIAGNRRGSEAPNAEVAASPQCDGPMDGPSAHVRHEHGIGARIGNRVLAPFGIPGIVAERIGGEAERSVREYPVDRWFWGEETLIARRCIAEARQSHCLHDSPWPIDADRLKTILDRVFALTEPEPTDSLDAPCYDPLQLALDAEFTTLPNDEQRVALEALAGRLDDQEALLREVAGDA
ncbi:MAG: hypothetical protein KDC95_14110 [Planctomycetes bacterium]|nr:hypothetical protein [Planctomycetota bacterium]